MRAIALFCLLSLLPALSISLHAQQKTEGFPLHGQVHVSVTDPPGTPPRKEFSLPDSTITLLYTPDLKPEDPALMSKLQYHAQFGELAKTATCHPILLMLGSGNSEPETENPKDPHFHPGQPMGGIVLQELLPGCYSIKTDDDAADFLDGVLHMDGFQPLTQIVEMKLDGHPTFFTGAIAFSKDKDGVRRASVGRTIVGSVAMRYNNRTFLWTIVSNNAELFSHLLELRIRFRDDAKPWPLVPFRLDTINKRNASDALPR